MLRWWHGLGLRAPLVLLVLVPLVPVILLFLYHTHEDQARIVAGAEDRALQLARAWAAHHDDVAREAEILLEAATRVAADADTCKRDLPGLTRSVMWSSPVAVVDRAGHILCTSDLDGPAPDGFDAAFIGEVFDNHGLQIDEFKRDRRGRSVALVGLRLPRAEAGAERAAVTLIDLAEIARRTEPDAKGAHFGMLLLSRTGAIMAQEPADTEILGTRLGSGHPLIPKINLEIEGTADGRTTDGIEHIFAFTQLPQTGAKIAIELTRDEVLGAQSHAIQHLLLVFLLVALFAAAAALLLAERAVMRRVGALGRAAEAFGRGRFDHRVNAAGASREFAALGEAFNGMADLLAARQRELQDANDAIRTANADLERRVEERTAELRIVHDELLKQERLSTLGRLTATVAHELRNPLSAIKNTLFTLRELSAAKGVDIERPAARMERCIERCNHIVSGLLNYSNFRALRRQYRPFDSWLREVIEDQALPAGIAVATDLRVGRETVGFDPELFRRVVVNLLDNAVQALNEPGSVRREKRITFGSFTEQGRLVFTIEDNGPGIDADILGKIFEPLFSTKSLGTGLGLSTVKQIVEQHGGDIRVESEKGMGTCVVVRLVLLAAERAA